MERCRSHPVWEARTDFGSVGVIDDADQMPTTPRHRGGRCESGLSEIKRFGVGASLFERNENRVHISDALLISPECPVPAGASRPAGTPVPSAQLLEPHSSASPPVLLHCVHHGLGGAAGSCRTRWEMMPDNEERAADVAGGLLARRS